MSHLQPPKVDRHYYRVNMIYGYLRRLFGCFSCRLHSYFAGALFLFEDLVTTAVSIIQMFVSNSQKRRDMFFFNDALRVSIPNYCIMLKGQLIMPTSHRFSQFIQRRRGVARLCGSRARVAG